MEEIKIVLDQAIPKDYSMLKISALQNEILEIGVIKVRNHRTIAKCITLIKPEAENLRQTLHFKHLSYNQLEDVESIDIAIPRILNIISTDTIIYIGSDNAFELLKSKCKSLGIQINNTTLKGINLWKAIPTDIKGIVSNYLETLSIF